MKFQRSLFILLMLISAARYTSIASSRLSKNTPFSSNWMNFSKDSLNLDSTKNKADSLVDLKKKKNVINSMVIYSAKDSMVLNVQTGEMELYSGAKADYENIKLKADYIKFNQKENTLYAKGIVDTAGEIIGKPIFQDNSDIYNSDEIAYNFKTKKGKIKEVRTKEGEGYLIGEQVKKNDQEEFFIKNGKYTTCNAEHPHFYIAVTKAKKSGNYIVSGPAYLVVEDIPLPLALPFGFFPTKSGRASGVLMPTLGEDTRLGFFLRDGGYYFGINDYFDLSLRGSIYSKGSYDYNITNRYFYKYHFNGDFSFAYSDKQFGEPETIDYSRSKDFRVGWQHKQQSIGRGSNFSANVNIVSPSFNKFNSGYNINTYVQNILNSSVSYSKTFQNAPMNYSVNLNHSQNLNNHSLDLSIPGLYFNVNRINPFDKKSRTGKQKWFQKISIAYALKAENKIATTDTAFQKGINFNDFQNGMQQDIPLSTSFNIFKFFNVSPNLNYSERWYLKHQEKFYQQLTKQDSNGFYHKDTIVNKEINGFISNRNISFNTGLSTRIYGMYAINKLKIVALRHVINPSVSLDLRPDYSDPSFGYFKTVQKDSIGIEKLTYSIFENTIFGGPSGGKSALLRFTLGNNFEMKVKSKSDTITGTRKIKLLEYLNGFGSYNLLADSLKLSTITLTANTRLFDRMDIRFDGRFDPYARVIDSNNKFVRINTFEYQKNKKLSRLEGATISLRTNLNSEAFKKSDKRKTGYQQEDIDFIYGNYLGYVDFDIPWSLNVDYNLRYSPDIKTEPISQTLNFNGDVSVTKKWKIGFTSGYDFNLEKLSSTSLNIYRDLHCWDLSFRWIPFGQLQSYNVEIKVKSTILKDLKLTKRREFYER